MTEKDDLYYIRSVKQGEVEDFVYLVRRYDKMVFTTVNKIIQRREVAEDITQEVFLKVFQSLNSFREDSEFSTWLYRIAYNMTISELRKSKYNQQTFEVNYDNIVDTDLNEEVDKIDIETQLRYLEQVLSLMPQEDALLVTLFYFNEQTIRQISEITGYTESNVKVKLYRIRKYMCQEINKLSKDG